MSQPTGRFGARRRNHLGCAFAAVALLLGVVPSPAGSASLPGEVTATTDSVVETVGGVVPPTPTASGVPEAPPTTPQAAPNVEAAPPQEPTPPAPGVSALPKVAAGPDVAGSVERTAGVPQQAAGAATGSAPESSAAPSLPRDGGAANPYPGARGGGRTARGEERSTPGFEFTPVRWFLAYVWPAIALTADVPVPTSPIARIERNPQKEVPAIALAPLGHGRDHQLAATVPLPRHPAPPASATTSPWHTVRATGARILLYFAIAGLLALFAFAVWTELPPEARWPRPRG